MFYKKIVDFYIGLGVLQNNATYSFFTALLLIVIICIIAKLILRQVISIVFAFATKKTKLGWNNVFIKNRLFHRIANFFIPALVYYFGRDLPISFLNIDKITGVITVLVFLLFLHSLLKTVDEIYKSFEVSKTHPIKGILQVVEVVVFVLALIVGIAILFGQSPMVLLGGVGALTAVISLVFKDAILGFVAGILLTSNDMIRIGDWIEVPKLHANGTVIDLNMTTIRIENFDKTVTLIPAYALTSDSFISWRAMLESRARRIKRSFFIEISGIRHCDQEMIETFRRIDLISEYIDTTQKHLESQNSSLNITNSDAVNQMRMTNLGTMRAYISNYLKSHPGIRKDMVIMVRQLDATESGIPIEVYAFAATAEWDVFENIQSDIFDHIYSTIPVFGLHLYQKPSGNDIKSCKTSM